MMSEDSDPSDLKPSRKGCDLDKRRKAWAGYGTGSRSGIGGRLL